MGQRETSVVKNISVMFMIKLLAWFVYCMTTVNTTVNHCCQALLPLCKGSALIKFTYLPSGGTNSCLDFFPSNELPDVSSLFCLQDLSVCL